MLIHRLRWWPSIGTTLGADRVWTSAHLQSAVMNIQEQGAGMWWNNHELETKGHVTGLPWKLTRPKKDPRGGDAAWLSAQLLWRNLGPGSRVSGCRGGAGPVFSRKLQYIAGFGLVETAISTNPKHENMSGSVDCGVLWNFTRPHPIPASPWHVHFQRFKGGVWAFEEYHIISCFYPPELPYHVILDRADHY